MQSNHATYVHSDSIARIDEILDASDNDYQEVDSIPPRDKLTFKNGYYSNCTALFVDIRDSSKLPEKHRRPRLARIYRSYISECVAVINGDPKCIEVNIHGDAVWGIIDTRYQSDIDAAFSTAARLNSLIETLNCRLKKRGIDPIRAGIGMSWGRALMIKAGFKGFAINEVVWMGDVVNHAAHLCHLANRWPAKQILVANDVYTNLNADNKKLLAKNYTHDCYEGHVVNVEMSQWRDQNCGG